MRSNYVELKYTRMFIFQDVPVLFYLDGHSKFRAFFPPVGREESFVSFLRKIASYVIENYTAEQIRDNPDVRIPLDLFDKEDEEFIKFLTDLNLMVINEEEK